MHTRKDRIRNTIQTLSRVWAHTYTWLHNTYMKEVKAQRSYWDSWTRDPSLLRRGMHCIVYVPFTLPMRLWTLCPSPERVALLLGGVTVLADMYPGYDMWWKVYAFLLLSPFAWMALFCFFWYCVFLYEDADGDVDGESLLTRFFYGEKNIALFFGDPLSTLVLSLNLITGACLFGSVYLFIQLIPKLILLRAMKQKTDASSIHAQRVLKITKVVAKRTTQKVQQWKTSGVPITEEMVLQAWKQAYADVMSDVPPKDSDTNPPKESDTGADTR